MRSIKDPTQTKTVHVVTSEFTAGSLRFALDYPKKVLALPDFLAVGPLWKLDEEVGLNNRIKWLENNINEHPEPDFEKKFNEFSLTIREISADMPLYIWAGNNASEQIGLRFILHVLRNEARDVITINSTEACRTIIEPGSKSIFLQHTAQAEPEVLKRLFEQERQKNPLSVQKRNRLSQEWEELAETEHTLHIWKKGSIQPSPEDTFDPLILQVVKKFQIEQENQDFIPAGCLVGKVMRQSDDIIGSDFLAYRLRKLIMAGVLEMTGTTKSLIDYSVRISRKKDNQNPFSE